MKNSFIWAALAFFFLWILSDLNDTEVIRKGVAFILMFISLVMVRIEILFDQLKRRDEK